MQKGLRIYLTVVFLDIRNLIPKEMLKSFSSPRDKQVAPDAIVKTDWTKCAICQQNKVEPLISMGDLVALEAKYHAPCLASLYKKTERVKGKKAKKMGQVLDDQRIWRFAELLSFIEKSHMVSTAMLPVFRLVELVGKYNVPFDTTWRKHTCTHSQYTSKRPHSFPNFSS